MSLQTALQVKQIQHSLRESWVLGQERHYGSTRNSFNRKISGLAQSSRPLLEASIEQALRERKIQSSSPDLQVAFKANPDEGRNQLFYNAPAPYPVTYGQSAALAKISPKEKSQDLHSATVMDGLLQLQSERNGSTESRLEILGEPQDKYFASKPNLPHELPSQYYTATAPVELAASENLKKAIERALGQASVVAQSRKSKKKYLYLAPWPKQMA
jgi:hypothetical protein